LTSIVFIHRTSFLKLLSCVPLGEPDRPELQAKLLSLSIRPRLVIFSGVAFVQRRGENPALQTVGENEKRKNSKVTLLLLMLTP